MSLSHYALYDHNFIRSEFLSGREFAIIVSLSRRPSVPRSAFAFVRCLTRWSFSRWAVDSFGLEQIFLELDFCLGRDL